MNPSISVIITTFNNEKYLRGAIQSVLRQTYKPYEVIVVDDGSKDNTRSIITEFDGKIRYLFQENRGPSAARNLGIGEAKCEFIAFLDADDVWDENKLQLQLEQICNSDTVGLVTCDRKELLPDGKTQIKKIDVNIKDMNSFLKNFTMKNYLEI